MTINKYWVKPKKRHNKTYRGSLTKRRKEINTNRAIVLLLAWSIFAITYAILNVSNNYIIDGNFVEASAEAQLFVSPERQESATPSSTELVVISAYSEYDSCHYPKIVNGERKCLVASGKIAKEGMIATNLYPFGTKLIIGGREFVVEDRISKRYNNRIDIFMGYGEDGYKKATEWGLKTLKVRNLTTK